MTTRAAFTSSLFVGIAMLLLPSAMATAQVTGACLSDAKSLCAGIQPGGGKIRDCLKSHVKDLSDDCQAVVLKVVNAKACAGDVKQFCADTKPGEGRVEACMKAHVADVSDACKVAMANEAAGDD